MISQKEITLDWINKVAKENRNADKILVEKVIRALLLLEGLVKEKLPFVFKGGTALMLHLNSTKRLSIDIDIILPTTPKNLEDILDVVAKEQGFIQPRNYSTETLNPKLRRSIINFSTRPFINQIRKKNMYCSIFYLKK